VVGVADGDTITLLDRNRQEHKIRLAGIDAPQPYGQRSKQHLADLAFGKEAKADCYNVDRYDRDVGTVYVNGRNVGRGIKTGACKREVAGINGDGCRGLGK
jgi:endonuclease YncB( thermonuclease family)